MSKDQNIAAATVGRVLWVWIGEDDENITTTLGNDVVCLDLDTPFRGQVDYVHPNGAVNLSVTDHEGQPFTLHSVDVENPTEDENQHGQEGSSYATWMPYQQKQHEKQVAEESKPVDPVPISGNNPSTILTDGRDVG